MSLNVYLGCTIILILAVPGIVLSLFSLRAKKSKLWFAPVMALSTTIFITAIMYFLFAGLTLTISPWIAVLFIFSEIGSILGSYINEHMEPKSNLIRAAVIILSVIMFLSVIMLIMVSLLNNIA